MPETVPTITEATMAVLLEDDHLIKKLVLKLTHRIWNREIARLLCRAYVDGHINSKQLHTLTSWFDPTQKHRVY